MKSLVPLVSNTIRVVLESHATIFPALEGMLVCVNSDVLLEMSFRPDTFSAVRADISAGFH